MARAYFLLGFSASLTFWLTQNVQADSLQKEATALQRAVKIFCQQGPRYNKERCVKSKRLLRMHTSDTVELTLEEIIRFDCATTEEQADCREEQQLVKEKCLRKDKFLSWGPFCKDIDKSFSKRYRKNINQ